MALKVTDDSGQDLEVFTAEEKTAEIQAAVAAAKAEFEKTLADKDAHQAEKLRQLEEARKGATSEKDNATLLAEEAKKIAEEAKASIEVARKESLDTKRDFFIQSVVGGDPELTKKILENYDLLNMPAGNDAEIQARVQKAVGASGISSIRTFNGGMSFGGAMPATAPSNDKSVKDHNYDVFKNELGLGTFIPKKDNK
jgi:hypothetical protein